MMEDFNTSTNDSSLSEFSQFEYRGGIAENDWILSGKPASFPASASITGHVSTEMGRVPASEGSCRGPQVLWSDHCAVLTTLTIQ